MSAILLPGASATVPDSPRSAAGDAGFFAHHGVWAPGVRLFRTLRFASKAAHHLAGLRAAAARPAGLAAEGAGRPGTACAAGFDAPACRGGARHRRRGRMRRKPPASSTARQAQQLARAGHRLAALRRQRVLLDQRHAAAHGHAPDQARAGRQGPRRLQGPERLRAVQRLRRHGAPATARASSPTSGPSRAARSRSTRSPT